LNTHRRYAEQVLRLAIANAAGRQEPAVLENAHVNGLQYPQNRRATRQKIKPNVKVVPDAFVTVHALSTRARWAINIKLRLQIGSDLTDDRPELIGHFSVVARERIRMRPLGEWSLSPAPLPRHLSRNTPTRAGERPAAGAGGRARGLRSRAAAALAKPAARFTSSYRCAS
jgi:hypothetical protein